MPELPSNPARARTGAAVRLVLVLAAAVLVLAMPVATWWLVGDQSTVPASVGRDYAFRPWDISPAAAAAAGIGSLVLAVTAMAVLVRAASRHLFDQRWWAVLILLLAAGFIAGAGWRVMTAGVIGANIGAGLVVLFGGPVVAILLMSALIVSVTLLVRARRPAARRVPREDG